MAAMSVSTAQQRRELESLSRERLAAHQVARLNQLLRRLLPHNRFYAEKLAEHVDLSKLSETAGPVRDLTELAHWPFTYKQELIAPRGLGTANLTFDRKAYTRFHQTSGTHGRPLPVLDTAEDWRWWMEVWQYVLDAAGLERGDCVYLAFSFGPFIGFWSAFDAAIERGCLTVPGGGMTTLARLDMLRSCRPAAIFCTPSYALHMAEIAAGQQIDVGSFGVKSLILAGEPGGSLPGTRERIESAWQAKVLDHAGASEVGPWGVGDAAGGGVRVIESEFIAEFLSVDSGEAAADGELAELVITNLGRVGNPILRYRTGDLVRPERSEAGTNHFVLLAGGVVGRADDMLIVRGVNVFPSSLDQIVRSFPEIVEYRAIVRRTAEMDQLVVEIEDHLAQPNRVARELQTRLGLKAEVHSVPLLTLPRFEGKGKRLFDER